MENQKNTILIVEDDPFLAKLYQSQLEKEGYNITSLMRGETVLEKCKEINPDLIILDILLPSMSGFEVLEALKKDPATKDIKVLILSNLGQDEDVSRGLALGAVDYIIKVNITAGEVIENIKKHLQ